MFCPNCNAQIPDDSAFCPACGGAVNQAGAPPQFSQPAQPNYGYQQQGYMNQQAMRPMNLPVAGVGPRAAAIIVDAIIFIVLYYIMLAVFGGTSTIDTGYGTVEYNTGLHGFPALLYMIIGLAYYIVLEGMMGATVGKMIVGLKVVSENGGKIGYKEATIRTLLRIIDGLFCYLVGAIVVWTSPSKQRLGDKVAHTLVIKSRGSNAARGAMGAGAGYYGNQTTYDNFSNDYNNNDNNASGSHHHDNSSSWGSDNNGWDSSDSGNDSGGSDD